MKFSARFLGLLLLSSTPALPLFAATVTGNLTDISIQPLTTKLLFTPTTNVLLTPSGLSAGPAKVITTTNGAFSLDLEAGDYTVSLPLIPARSPFHVSVFSTNGAVNITNLLSSPTVYTYTNYLATAPIHVNGTGVIAWSTNGASTLFDSPATLPAGILSVRNVLAFDAFGSASDPTSGAPTMTFNLKLGSTVVCTQSKTALSGNWHLRGIVTVRSTGVSGSVVAAMAIIQENGSIDALPFASSVTTINTTGALSIDLTAAIDDFTGMENVTCDQLLLELR